MANTVTLRSLLTSLHSAVVELVVAPAGTEITVESVALLDGDDLRRPPGTAADLTLLVGVTETDALRWFDDLALRPVVDRPLAVLTKVADSTALAHAARETGIALVAVHHQTRWELLLSTMRGVLDQSRAPASEDGLFGADTDLYELAQTVASLTKGMVSIEDERSHVLAYSASDDSADELRTLSILGREGPADYLRRLHERGVFDRLRRTDDVIDVPADAELGIRRRLAVGIRRISGAATTLGTIWVQEGARPLSVDADAVLRGASAVAARLITRIANAPTNEALQIQRLLGARGGGVDIPSLAAALSIPTTGTAAVVGFAACGEFDITGLAPSIRLHASAFRRDSLVTVIGERIYVLFSGAASGTAIPVWTADAVSRIETRTGLCLRAAVAAPIAELDGVAAARFEVDRVLDATTGDVRVTTLAESRTSVLLGEIVDIISNHEQLRDPRIAALDRYDATHDGAMRESLETYLACFGDVRAAAERLHIHPNTVRYRIRRVEQILELDLSDPDARLLVEIQLRM
ncbi:helix-turn-helix domain-containing protein [Rhodococcus fascians]|uniref:PucR family transcriptional regulator n=1 Tax=Rhodococcoides fascians TaxID=1828 RepID=UPI0019594685|nr:helix-turn-helix domain-containing protein [Rhodococcus fascians]MBM7242030.1 helix-turn-helix domain-containing protein [Rhodococcus fascians]MBY3808734.1 helix-turn-helix domain-containing protein [Rhodococcus fascians]MBY3840178.1 helix-turn-helix domain-containing protein [Rhodococcus fascians]MBY3845057.1 helix-turn-helix domain-containing protein [Rhodococcus fascians]MBY3848621.1 helix-turn-helix domain-containing protein [Rhodococcus fascians]